MAYEAESLDVYVARCKADIQTAMTYLSDGTLRPVPYLLMLVCRDGIGAALAAVEWLLATTDETTAAQAVPGTSVGEGIDNHGQPVNRFRREASATRLAVRVWGTTGKTLPAGSQARRDDGFMFATTAEHLFTVNGYTDLTFEAAEGGSKGDTAAGLLLALTTPPAGINSACTVQSIALAGLDAEMDDVYRPDVVAAYQGAGARGGRDSDWVSWCKEVAGVYNALVTTSGPGRVTLTIQAAGPSAPDTDLLDAVTAHLLAEHDVVDVLWEVVAWEP